MRFYIIVNNGYYLPAWTLIYNESKLQNRQNKKWMNMFISQCYEFKNQHNTSKDIFYFLFLFNHMNITMVLCCF